MTTRLPVGIFFALFTVSGFAGLIYESIWSHYLKLFLGHAAYAQTLVVAIFMGGLALGSARAAHLVGRWRNVLVAYAVTAATDAAGAVVFDALFVVATGRALDPVLPRFPRAK